jgi:hypothetical protein
MWNPGEGLPCAQGEFHQEDIMKRNEWNVVRIAAWAVVCGVGLTACGGDGGDEPTPEPRGTVTLTTVNRDTAARATATSVMALGVSMAIPFAADAGAVALQATAPAPFGAARLGPASWLPTRVLDAMWQAAGAQNQPARSASMRPLAVIVVPPEACAVSGTVALTWDDRDNNGQPSVGDVWAFVFDQCQDNPTDVLNGSVTATFTSIGATTLPTFSARLSFSQLSDEAINGRHGMTLNGNAVLDYVQTSTTAERLKVTADGDVVAAVHTHLPYTDTVTLRSGFVQDAAYDSTTGLTTTTMNGSIQSQTLGGTVVTSTVTPIVVADSDSYPRSGVVKALGSAGEVRLTAVSASQVRIELDADDNGTFESSYTDSWDWLL